MSVETPPQPEPVKKCPVCKSPNLMRRVDGTFFCRSCGNDTRVK